VFPGDDAFVRGLAQGGHVIGRNVQIDSSGVGVGIERLAERARRLVERRVAVIVTVGNITTRSARQATSSIPIVMMGAEDPVEDGLVSSLARPGGNVTGLAIPSAQLVVKQVELLREIVPDIARIAILWSPDALQAARIARIEQALAPIGVQVQRIALSHHIDTQAALALVTRSKADALLPLEHLAYGTLRRDLSMFALHARVPLISTTTGIPMSGALLRYGPSGVALFESAGIYVSKILHGAKPVQLPVEEPTRFELSVNLSTAKILGLAIPPSLLARADQVIE
jgi:putative ABC transport system substrate-binding protein